MKCDNESFILGFVLFLMILICVCVPVQQGIIRERARGNPGFKSGPMAGRGAGMAMGRTGSGGVRQGRPMRGGGRGGPRFGAFGGASGTGLGPRRWGGRRHIVNPIGIYGYPAPYVGVYPYRRYYPEFETQYEKDMLNCMDTCIMKSGEDFQECLKFCKELYPPSYTVF